MYLFSELFVHVSISCSLLALDHINLTKSHGDLVKVWGKRDVFTKRQFFLSLLPAISKMRSKFRFNDRWRRCWRRTSCGAWTESRSTKSRRRQTFQMALGKRSWSPAHLGSRWLQGSFCRHHSLLVLVEHHIQRILVKDLSFHWWIWCRICNIWRWERRSSSGCKRAWYPGSKGRHVIKGWILRDLLFHTKRFPFEKEIYVVGLDGIRLSGWQ